MDIQHFFITILAGVVGTIAMTICMYLYSFSTKQFTKVIHILGNMLVGESNYYTPSRNAWVIGTIAHFGVGVLFSFAYFLLWNWGVFRINLEDSVLIGFISGVLAIGVWQGYIILHSHPPTFSHIHFFIALLIAHIIFGLVSVNVFQMITDNPELWYQLQEEAKIAQ
ncbi:DUF6789 family protein [Algoriphagus winogradskyi]|uniref:DUF1440 domain-containing protein n=1 Tax=Algoriphagus winogradskyi TaxID=237017 RepID=A0ABY1NZT5_9BACT|nr:DUF6789 family protein [Algoriphagus winogradskyi]SMP22935.1 hypothetical protein SAMN06265367_103512 [Algoriphagus winogradskyi]